MNARMALGGLALATVAFVAFVVLVVDPRDPGDAPATRTSPAVDAIGVEGLGEELARQMGQLRTELALETSARRELEGQLAALRAQLAARGAIAAEAPATAFRVPIGAAAPQPLAGSAANPVAGEPGGVGPGASWTAAPKRPSANTLTSLAGEAQGTAPGASWPGAPQAVAATSADALPEPEPASANDSSEESVFDTVALVSEVGLHPDDALALRERWEQFSLDRLDLVDQANREGWRDKPKFRRQATLLEDEIFEEIGEESFDQLLYATGRSNRVVVRDVLENSTAEHAGLKPGDIILRYDDRAVFDTRKLQAATAGGELGELVRLELLRDGEIVTVDVERGPLGTLLRASHEFPDLR